MKTENLESLQKNLKYLGFGELANEALKSELSTGKESFKIDLNIKPVSPDLKEDQSVKYSLAFTKSKTADHYYLNSYTAQLTGNDIKDQKEQNFALHNGNGITSKEAFNLLAGRAVNKDIINKADENVNVWIKLNTAEGGPDKNYYNKNYGFDLNKVVDNLNAKFTENFTRESVIKSLEKGNLQSVFVKNDSLPEQVYIAANPQYKKLDIFDKDLKPVFIKVENLNTNQKPWEGGENAEKKTGVSR